jgi:hypothetical protein
MFCLSNSVVFAESSKMTKVDIDVKTTHIIKADLGRDDLFYYMDLTACICWVSQSMGSSFAVSTFDCAKLEKHPKLEKYIAECGAAKRDISINKEEPAVKPDEIKTEEVKKEEIKPETDVKEPVDALPVKKDKEDKTSKK